MVGLNYLLDKPQPPSGMKVLVDQTIIPAAIDVAGACEVALQRVVKRTGVGVPWLLGGTGAVIGLLVWRSLRPRGRRLTRYG